MRFGVPTQPVGMDARQVHRHANLATHPCNTRVILFSPRPSERVGAITPARVLRLTSVLHGILVPHPVRGDRYPLLWRGWSDSSTPLRYLDIPPSSDLDPLWCLRMCTWEYDEDLVPPPPPSDEDKSAVATARRRLLALRSDTDNPFPKHIVPRDFVAFLRAHTHVSATYVAMAAVAVVRAGLGGQFTFERARAAMIACVLRALHFHTPQSMLSMRGVPVVRDRCHACRMWVVSRWGISDAHGEAARTLIDAYVENMTNDGADRPPPFDRPRVSVHSDVVRVVAERVRTFGSHGRDPGVLGVCHPGGPSDPRASGCPGSRGGGTFSGCRGGSPATSPCPPGARMHAYGPSTGLPSTRHRGVHPGLRRVHHSESTSGLRIGLPLGPVCSVRTCTIWPRRPGGHCL